MLTYSIFDRGNLVDAFDTRHEAVAALADLSADAAAGRDDPVLVTFDDDGLVVSEDPSPET